MALKTSKISEIPQGSKSISKAEAVDFQLDIMETLCPEKKRFFVKNGKILASLSCATTTVYIQSYYRRSVNVLYYGRINSMFPAVLIPSFASGILHSWLITNNIIIQKWACPICYHIRSGFINVTLGTLYPAIVAPIVAFSYARRIKSYDVPPLNNKKIWNFFLNKMKPIQGRLGLFTCLHLFIGAALAEMEARENNDFNQNINKYINDYVEREARAKAGLHAEKKESH